MTRPTPLPKNNLKSLLLVPLLTSFPTSSTPTNLDTIDCIFDVDWFTKKLLIASIAFIASSFFIDSGSTLINLLISVFVSGSISMSSPVKGSLLVVTICLANKE